MRRLAFAFAVALARLSDRGKTSILRDALGDPAVRSGPQGEDVVPRLGRSAGTGADATGLVPLVGDLADPDAVLRRAGVAALAAARDPLSTDARLRGPGDPDGQVRALAVQGLAGLGNPRAFPSLVVAPGPWRETAAALDVLDGRDHRAQALVDAVAEHRDIRPRWAAQRLVMRAERFDITLEN